MNGWMNAEGNERNLCGFERWNWNEDVLVREILKC